MKYGKKDWICDQTGDILLFNYNKYIGISKNMQIFLQQKGKFTNVVEAYIVTPLTLHYFTKQKYLNKELPQG